MSKNKIKFIKELTKEEGYVMLSSACGNYYGLSDNGKEILAMSFVGKYGYKQTPIEKLSEKTINVISMHIDAEHKC